MKKLLIGITIKLLLITLLPFSWSCFAQPVFVNGPSQQLLLNHHMQYLKDPSGSLTVTDVLSDEYVYSWQAAQKTTKSFGLEY